MGWFTRKRPQPLAPDELRDALFEAVHAGNAKRLRELVDAQPETIGEHFRPGRRCRRRCAAIPSA